MTRRARALPWENVGCRRGRIFTSTSRRSQEPAQMIETGAGRAQEASSMPTDLGRRTDSGNDADEIVRRYSGAPSSRVSLRETFRNWSDAFSLVVAKPGEEAPDVLFWSTPQTTHGRRCSPPWARHIALLTPRAISSSTSRPSPDTRPTRGSGVPSIRAGVPPLSMPSTRTARSVLPAAHPSQRLSPAATTSPAAPAGRLPKRARQWAARSRSSASTTPPGPRNPAS